MKFEAWKEYPAVVKCDGEQIAVRVEGFIEEVNEEIISLWFVHPVTMDGYELRDLKAWFNRMDGFCEMTIDLGDGNKRVFTDIESLRVYIDLYPEWSATLFCGLESINIRGVEYPNGHTEIWYISHLDGEEYEDIYTIKKTYPSLRNEWHELAATVSAMDKQCLWEAIKGDGTWSLFGRIINIRGGCVRSVITGDIFQEIVI